MNWPSSILFLFVYGNTSFPQFKWNGWSLWRHGMIRQGYVSQIGNQAFTKCIPPDIPAWCILWPWFRWWCWSLNYNRSRFSGKILMKMDFKSFASILAGMSLIGLSIGFILGYYLHGQSQTYLWMYLSAPFLGIGSGLVIYGTLYRRNVN